jgi:hypothetical protein
LKEQQCENEHINFSVFTNTDSLRAGEAAALNFRSDGKHLAALTNYLSKEKYRWIVIIWSFVTGISNRNLPRI